MDTAIWCGLVRITRESSRQLMTTSTQILSVMFWLKVKTRYTVEFEPGDSVTVTSAKIFAVREAEIEEKYPVDQHVDVLYPKLGNSWWTGRIKKIVSNNTFEIIFANGDKETVKLNRLRIHYF